VSDTDPTNTTKPRAHSCTCLPAILSNAEHISALTHDAPRESCHSEIEVMIEEQELVAKAVVDVVAAHAVKLDKAKFTKIVKARAEAEEWKGLEVHKRQVPIVSDQFGKDVNP
jgi:hypothetical protein